jgi:hypothetical protein
MNYNDRRSDKPVYQVSNDQSNEDLVPLTGVPASIKETVMRDQGRSHEETANHAVKEKKFIEPELEG